MRAFSDEICTIKLCKTYKYHIKILIVCRIESSLLELRDDSTPPTAYGCRVGLTVLPQMDTGYTVRTRTKISLSFLMLYFLNTIHANR